MADCIFCRIVSGGIPSYLVFEDERVIAFLDINPVAIGHTLVIPKAHSTELAGMSPEDMTAVGAALRRLAPAVAKAVGAEGYNILNNCGAVAGQAVGHVHFHIIPRTGRDGRGYRWLTFSYREGQAALVAGDISTAVG